MFGILIKGNFSCWVSTSNLEKERRWFDEEERICNSSFQTNHHHFTSFITDNNRNKKMTLETLAIVNQMS